MDHALALEHPRDGARGAEVASLLLEDVADLGAGAVTVIGQDVDQEGDAPGRIPLVRDLLVRLAGQLARALLDRPFDVVLGPFPPFGHLYCGLEAPVRPGFSAPLP